jgi:hypothetical protein
MAISRLQSRDFSRDHFEISKSNLEINKYNFFSENYDAEFEKEVFLHVRLDFTTKKIILN